MAKTSARSAASAPEMSRVASDPRSVGVARYCRAAETSAPPLASLAVLFAPLVFCVSMFAPFGCAEMKIAGLEADLASDLALRPPFWHVAASLGKPPHSRTTRFG